MSALRILIVDDESFSRKILEQCLREYGECDTVTDGLGAVQAVRAAHVEGRRYDCVMLDIDMPSMNGHEALATIRKFEDDEGIEKDDSVNVIMVTGCEETDDYRQSFDQRCSAYIVKPIKKQNLDVALKRLGLI